MHVQPATGMPPGATIVDFNIQAFTAQIERSPRMIWERRSVCPCAGVTETRKHADPTCALCLGLGEFWFGPPGYVVPAEYELTAAQRAIQTRNGGAVIRGLMTTSMTDVDDMHQLGPWTSGTQMITVRPENKIGQRDRFFAIDDTQIFTEVRDVEGTIFRPRYPVVEVIDFRTVDAVIDPGSYTLVDGDIVFSTAVNQRMSIVYLHHPAWVVVDIPKTIRHTTSAGAALPRSTVQPREPQVLLIQAKVAYELDIPGDEDRIG